jgi:molecular chaperone GrpE
MSRDGHEAENVGDDIAEEIEIEVVEDDGLPVSLSGDENEADASDVGDSGGEDPVTSLAQEVEHLREMYLRKLAEFDNYRKRTEREREDFVKTAGEAIVLDLIPVLDNFERALEHASESEPKVFRQGVEMISKQLFDVLARRGLEQFNPQGQVFEPEYHEAVQRVTDPDHPPGTVAWVLAKGYRFGGRLVRPAMVGVSMEPEEQDPSVGTADSAGEEESS